MRNRCSPRTKLLLYAAIVQLGARLAHAETSIIPLPEVIVDPNEGVTVGVLPVILNAAEDKTIRAIIAPDVRYNDITGIYPTFRYLGYPDPQQHYTITAGKGVERGEDAEGEYSGQHLVDGWLNVYAKIQHEQDPFERFFGIGNNTTSSDESNYTSTTDAGQAVSGVNLPIHLEASLQVRAGHVHVGQGGVTSVTQLRSPESGYADINGAQGATIVGPRFGVAYDTRDAPDIPTEGIRLDGGVEIIDKAFGSSTSFMKYGSEAEGYIPLCRDKQYVVALHSALDYLQNSDAAPFFELNSIGGIHSLRSHGSHRFTDNHRFLFQGELRSNVYEREIFGVHAHLEVAPFIDAARVFDSSRDFPLQGLHTAGGVGLRAVVVPQVVAYVDLGTDGTGLAAFTGINYPF